MRLPPGVVIAVGAWLLVGAGMLLARLLLGAKPDLVLAILVSQAAVALPVVLLLVPLRPRHLGLDLPTPRAWLAGAALGPLAFVVSLACLGLMVAVAGPQPKDMPVDQIIRAVDQRLGLVGLLLCAAVLPGVVEEALFRGVMLTGLRRHLSDWAAVLVAALLFAVLHLDRWRFLPQLALGILCGWLTLRTRSCWPAAAMHAVHNACVLVAGHVVRG